MSTDYQQIDKLKLVDLCKEIKHLQSTIAKQKERVDEAYQRGKKDMQDNCNRAVDERTRYYNEKVKEVAHLRSTIEQQAKEIEGLKKAIEYLGKENNRLKVLNQGPKNLPDRCQKCNSKIDYSQSGW